MSLLVIDNKTQTEIERVKKYAEDNPLTVSKMLDILNNVAPPIGDNPNYVCKIPVDYRVAFSVEAQPAGMARHISISKRNGLPGPHEVEMIIRPFGFTKPLNPEYIYEEKEINAINVIEYIDN